MAPREHGEVAKACGAKPVTDAGIMNAAKQPVIYRVR
jgi:hypothetical protein